MSTIWDNQQSAPAASQGGAQNSWYNPNINYSNLPAVPLSVGQEMRESSYPVAFNSYLNNAGVADNESNASRWAYAQQPRFQRGHQLALQQNPYLTMDQFIATLPGLRGVMSQFNQLGPDARGAQYSRFAPNVRTINR